MSKQSPETLTKNKTIVYLSGIIAVFTALVAGNITRWSIWFDEAFSAYLMHFNLAEITGFTAVDVHPPFYYWLLKFWTSLFGTSELAFRSMSWFFGVVALIGVYVLIRKLFKSSKMALVAAGAVAVTPIFLRFAMEARMYTLALAIVIWATIALVMAKRTNDKKYWTVYGILVAIGMLTHYFTALAWLAHWAWRYFEKRQGRLDRFWTKPWIFIHVLAVALFSPWLAIAVKQFATVQAGFWIPSVGAYTPVDYLSNTILYRQYGEVLGWWAVGFVVAVAIGLYLLIKHWRTLAKLNPSGMSLIASIALVPPLLLFILSLPPLRSSFIDRYVMYSQVLLMALVGIGVYLSVKSKRRRGLWLGGILLIVASLGAGNVYYYGNYNKNSSTSIRTREVVRQIQDEAKPGTPIVVSSPWVYYEASFYDTTEHPIYFADEKTTYDFGSLEMLKQSDIGKIKSLKDFAKNHRYIWYIYQSNEEAVEPPLKSWQPLRYIGAYDNIDHSTKYRAVLFDTQPSK